MNTRYFTTLGEQGKGRGVNRTPDSALKYTHDILKRAAVDKLDVFMLCGSLRGSMRDRLFVTATGKSFAELVRAVLEVQRNVLIFLWDEPSEDQHSEACRRLMEDATNHPEWGTLEIRSSGTREGSDLVNHFIVAKSRDDSRWILRVEEPHGHSSDEQIDRQEFAVPAAIFFDSDDARQYGQPLMKMFKKLWDAVDAAEQARNTQPCDPCGQGTPVTF